MIGQVKNMVGTESGLEPFRAHHVFPFLTFIGTDGPVDPTRPVLHIGYKATLELYPDFNILEYQIDKNTFWCFSPQESPFHFMSGFENYLDAVGMACVQNVTVERYNPIFHSVKDLETIREVIVEETEEAEAAFINDGALYFCTGQHVTVIDAMMYSRINGLNAEGVLTYVESKVPLVMRETEERKCQRKAGEIFNIPLHLVTKYIPYFMKLTGRTQFWENDPI